MSPDRRWVRVLAEGAVIVASILLAFGIDAWWEGHGQRGEERQVLLGLQEEFGGYADHMVWRAERNDGLIARLMTVLTVDELDESTDVREFDLAFHASIFHGTWDPGSRTRDALVASGRLELVRNEELRAALSAWGSTVDEVRDGELEMRSFVRESIVPYLASKGYSLGRAYWGGNADWPIDLEAPVAAKASYRQLFEDASFRSMVEYKLYWQRQSGSEYVSALDEAKRILAMVQAELER